jgi:hypothetical protein
LLEIGKSILRGNSGEASGSGDSVKAQDAVRWMQKAYNMIDQLDSTATPGMAELKLFNRDQFSEVWRGRISSLHRTIRKI